MSIHYSASVGGFLDTEIHGADIPADAVEVTPLQHAALLELQSQGKLITVGPNGEPTAVDRLPPTPEHVANGLRQAVQRHLDAKARDYGYDSILTAVSYADDPTVPAFRDEGRAFRIWRSACWAEVNGRLSEQPLPTAAELISGLPEFML